MYIDKGERYSDTLHHLLLRLSCTSSQHRNSNCRDPGSLSWYVGLGDVWCSGGGCGTVGLEMDGLGCNA